MLGGTLFPSHLHTRAVDQVAVVGEVEAPDDDALLGGDDVKAQSGAAEHAGHIVKDRVGLRLALEELDVGVEEVPLGDIDVLDTELVDEQQDARGERRLADGGEAAEGLGLGLVEEYDSVELRVV